MISVSEATVIIFNQTIILPTEIVPLRLAGGRVLAEPLCADRDFPPFTRVAMDGIAIRYDSYEAGQRRFTLEGTQAAGTEQQTLTNEKGCIEVMTGAVLPQGADTVVRYEDLNLKERTVTITADHVRRGQHAHPQGFDRKKGETIIAPGQRLFAAAIGVAATVGKASLQVVRPPKTVIIYTGDELVEVDEAPLPHQIRASNVHTIAVTLQNWGVEADFLHLPDDATLIRGKVAEALRNCDLILLSGGVSKGKYDLVPDALLETGVRQFFYKVAQRPGKPFWFGREPGGAVVFALPGNPVSAYVCTLRYVLPWLRKCLGVMPFDDTYGRLSEKIVFTKAQTYFLPVSTRSSLDGTLFADPREGKGSGDLANLVEVDGFLELPPEKDYFEKGQSFRFFASW
jgi:molybdopterin molybdotransferase